MLVNSTSHSQVEHWLFGETFISADAKPPFLSRDARLARDPIPEGVVGPRSSVLRERPSVVPGGAPRFLVEPNRPVRAEARQVRRESLRVPSRPLRIPKRARASCSPSYKEPTVDALAPEAEEGRGRLR
jgi:hypothetical protein